MADNAELQRYLAATDEELKVYIDAAHMSYLPVYLGRADARHALGQPIDAVLRELWLAARVYEVHGGVFLAKWPHTQVRRRRLEPLEVALVAGEPDTLKGVAKVFGIDPMTLFAGIEPDDVGAEVRALTTYFLNDQVADVIELAGTLAIFYALMLSSLATADIEGFEASRRRAMRLIDDQGHLRGGIAQGGVARIKAVHEALTALRPARPDVYARALVRHRALHDLELKKSHDKDPEAEAQARGALDRTALTLLVVARAFQLGLHDALRSAGADPGTLAYAEALGHTPAP